MKKKIAINLKVFSGIDKELNLKNYNPKEGLHLEVNQGVRLGRVLKQLGMKNLSEYVMFCAGERVSRWYKVSDGDSISCMRPVGGG